MYPVQPICNHLIVIDSMWTRYVCGL